MPFVIDILYSLNHYMNKKLNKINANLFRKLIFFIMLVGFTNS